MSLKDKLLAFLQGETDDEPTPEPAKPAASPAAVSAPPALTDADRNELAAFRAKQQNEKDAQASAILTRRTGLKALAVTAFGQNSEQAEALSDDIDATDSEAAFRAIETGLKAAVPPALRGNGTGTRTTAATRIAVNDQSTAASLLAKATANGGIEEDEDTAAARANVRARFGKKEAK